MRWHPGTDGGNRGPLHNKVDLALTVSIKRTLAVVWMVSACGGEHPTAPSLTPWTELPPISEQGKAYLKYTNIDFYSGVVTRWTNEEPPLVYAPHVSEQDQADAVAMLDSITGGGITVRFVFSEAEANVVVNDVWPPASYVAPSTCGLARVTKTVDNVIVRGEIDFNPRSPCVLDDGEHRRNILAHELGHVLGFREHTPGATDIMSAVAPWKTSAVLMEVGRWLYKVPPGTKPI